MSLALKCLYLHTWHSEMDFSSLNFCCIFNTTFTHILVCNSKSYLPTLQAFCGKWLHIKKKDINIAKVLELQNPIFPTDFNCCCFLQKCSYAMHSGQNLICPLDKKKKKNEQLYRIQLRLKLVHIFDMIIVSFNL